MSQRRRQASGSASSGRRAKDLRRASGRPVPRSAIGRARVQSGPTGRQLDPRIVLGIGAAAVLVVAVVILTGGFGTNSGGTGAAGSSGSASSGPSIVLPTGPFASFTARSSNPPGCPTSQPASLAAGQTRTVTIQTQLGSIVIKVDGSLSPIATGNFVALAQCGFYDGLVFHRIVPGFVIQGGDPAGDGSGGPGYTIQDDPITGTYARGTVAMARTQDPNSQGSQFFIVLDDSAASALNLPSGTPGYAIIGTVTSGMNVVDTIAAMPNSGDPDNVALEPIAMSHLTVATP